MVHFYSAYTTLSLYNENNTNIGYIPFKTHTWGWGGGGTNVRPNFKWLWSKTCEKRRFWMPVECLWLWHSSEFWVIITHTHTHMYTHMSTCMGMHKHMHTCTHAHTHTYTHTHTHTHTHTRTLPFQICNRTGIMFGETVLLPPPPHFRPPPHTPHLPVNL